MGLFSRKDKIGKSGFFKGFTDCHSHILPGVDDGFKTMEESLNILKDYEDAGITDVWLTPHIMEDIPNTPEELKARFGELTQAYSGPVKLHLAAENMLDALFKERLSKAEVLPLMNNMLLVETSYFSAPIDMDEMLGEVKSKGYFVVLAHPERYIYMDKKKYEKLRADNVYFQLNLSSLFGYYGGDARAKAEWMLKNGFYSFMGTDLHSRHSFEQLIDERVTEDTLKSLVGLKG